MSTSESSVRPSNVIFNIVTSMWAAQATAVAARLGIADQIEKGLTSSDAIADAVGASRDGVYRLMRACSTIGIFRETSKGQFVNTPVSETLRSDTPGSMRDFIIEEMAPGHWLPWGKLYDAVVNCKPTTFATLGSDCWTYYSKNIEEGAVFSRAMGNISAMASQAVLAKVDLSSFKHVMDVGGAFGEFLSHVLSANPTSTGVLYDLDHVIAGAKDVIAKKGLSNRVQLLTGSFMDSVPAGGDLYLLKHILHDWSDAECRTILQNIRKAMKPSSKVLIVELLIPEDGSPGLAQFMDLNMMVMLTGRERSAEEFSVLLASCGFKLERVQPTDSPFVAMIAAAG